jgi:recombination protein RecA
MGTALSKAAIESEIATRFSSAFNLRAKAAPEVIVTGIPEVDSLANGFPRGAITEIFGAASSGRTSLMLSALAQATTHDEVCALVDTNDTFDPVSAAMAGIDLDRLLWIRCAANLEHAFKATDLLLQGGGFGMVALDLGDVPTQQARRIISSWWYRFRRAVENTPTVLVVIAIDSCVRSCASLALEMSKEDELWSSMNNFSSMNNSTGPSETKFSAPAKPGFSAARFAEARNDRNAGFDRSDQRAFDLSGPRLLRTIQLRVERRKPVCSTRSFQRFQISHISDQSFQMSRI